MKRIFAAALLITIPSIVALAQTESRADVLKVLEAKRAELAKLETQFLAPSAEDRTTYAEFLNQPDTGLIRLLPREKFDSFEGKGSPLTVRGGGAYYSFARLTHEYGYGSDIELDSGYLLVGFAGADYGILTKLNNVRLEDVSTESPTVSFLAKYAVVTNDAEVNAEVQRFNAGKIIDGISYGRRVKAEVGATYVLRSISFNRSDLLVAFRIVRQDDDGSLIIAWKLLQKYPVPKLARAN